MAIKKAYVQLIEFLETNSGSKVKTILDDVKEMCSAKTAGGGGAVSNCIRNAEGVVTAIFCYYHKRWEPVVGSNAVEYGAKASSSTGLNSMCKEGTSAWTKQQTAAKKAKEQMLIDVQAGTLAVGDMGAVSASIEETRQAVSPRGDGIGWENPSDIDYGSMDAPTEA